MKPLASEYIWKLQPYVPGETIPHMIKLASNENPFGPSPKAVEAVGAAIANIHLYPAFERPDLKKRICEECAEYDVLPEQIVLGSGSTELIALLVRTLVSPNEAVMNAWPSFLMYSLAASVLGRQEIRVPLTSELEFDVEGMIFSLRENPQIKILFLGNPNNPTGTYLNRQALERLIAYTPDEVVIVLDEAYLHYVRAKDYPNGVGWVQKRPRTVVLRTFSKVYGLAGLRIGYAICDKEVASLLQRVKEPFNVNGIAQAAALAALDDFKYVSKSVLSNETEIQRINHEFNVVGLHVTPSQGNFILAHFPDARVAHDAFLRAGVITRPVENYGLLRALRITIGKPAENDVLLRALYSMDLN